MGRISDVGTTLREEITRRGPFGLWIRGIQCEKDFGLVQILHMVHVWSVGGYFMSIVRSTS